MAEACAAAPAALASSYNFAFTLPGGDVVSAGSLTATEVGAPAFTISHWSPSNLVLGGAS
jgi:hypothetical protein